LNPLTKSERRAYSLTAWYVLSFPNPSVCIARSTHGSINAMTAQT
jgi:hypothetical protein